MSAYPDLHDHIRALEEKGLLMRVTRPINKDTEMHPLVRWQFRGGIPESQRRAFLFENVTDSKGRRFDIPVAVGILASNRAIYSTGIGCDVEHLREKWDHPEQHPIEPVLGENPPCQEIVITGDALRRAGQGVDALPIPISTPRLRQRALCIMLYVRLERPRYGQAETVSQIVGRIPRGEISSADF